MQNCSIVCGVEKNDFYLVEELSHVEKTWITQKYDDGINTLLLKVCFNWLLEADYRILKAGFCRKKNATFYFVQAFEGIRPYAQIWS